MKAILISASLALTLALTVASNEIAMSLNQPPQTEISNGPVHMSVYLPDPQDGFYRGTRFDWSGVIHSLRVNGHEYYGPWFTKTRENVHDFVYEGADIVAGPCSATTGPADEFAPVGWSEAKPSDHFVKIGVGVLQKPDDAEYDNYRLYKIVDGGKWDVTPGSHSVDFVQTIEDSSSGFGYVYRKSIELTVDQPEMVLKHSLKNTGRHAIQTSVYNHNFLTLDRQAPGLGVEITFPFQITTPKPPDKALAEIRGNKIVYLNTLSGHDVATTPIEGFGTTAKDHEIRIEDTRVGAGMSIVADRPLLKASLWSIRTVVAVEPFIAIDVEPGQEFTWKSTYRYYALTGPRH